MFGNITKDAVIRLARSIAKVAAVGAITALIAYASDHQAENPALFAALLFALREADHLLGGDKPAPEKA